MMKRLIFLLEELSAEEMLKGILFGMGSVVGTEGRKADGRHVNRCLARKRLQRGL
jgi:hypothetical protein